MPFDYLSSRFRQVRRVALHRAGYQCETPGCPERIDLQVHHIHSVRFFPDRAYDLTNLIVRCRYHHAQAHGWSVIPAHWFGSLPPAANDAQFELPFTEPPVVAKQKT